MALKDTLKHQGLRNQLIKTLIKKGISDENVLKAMAKIPRHLFMNSSFEAFAYKDKAFPIGARADHFATLYSGLSNRKIKGKAWR